MIAGEVFAYEKLENSVRIWRCFSYDKQVELPEFLEGLPVTELAAYACSGHMEAKQLEELAAVRRLSFGTKEEVLWDLTAEKMSGMEPKTCLTELQLPPELAGLDLESICLPAGLKKIGRYAFYDCKQLRHISFYGTIEDLGSGLFTGCHQVEELTVTVKAGQPSCLKLVLGELSEELRINYRETISDTGTSDPGTVQTDTQINSCRLVFPQFYEEGGEDTPARNTRVFLHGSGMHFRNCFKENRFQFAWYDERFAHARFLERMDLTLEIALYRLRFPMELSEKARQMYEQYIKEHFLETGHWILKHAGEEELVWLFRQELFKAEGTREVLDELAEASRKLKNPASVSFLMDLKYQRFKPKAKSFEL